MAVGVHERPRVGRSEEGKREAEVDRARLVVAEPEDRAGRLGGEGEAGGVVAAAAIGSQPERGAVEVERVAPDDEVAPVHDHGDVVDVHVGSAGRRRPAPAGRREVVEGAELALEAGMGAAAPLVRAQGRGREHRDENGDPGPAHASQLYKAGRDATFWRRANPPWPRKEKFGKFVLLEEIDASGLGTEYRAAKLGPTGFEKIVTVLRLTPALSANAEGVKLLMDQVKFAAQLQNPNIIKILGIGGKVGSPCWVSYEFFEGKNLKAVFGRCRQEGFPFSIDHALLITSKVSTALEYAHARKTESGGRYFHGFVTPANVLVSYEGEVRLRGFGYWPARVRELGAVSESDALYLAPEQAAGGAGDAKSDTFSVGALLFEMLTGQPLQEAGKPFDPARVTGARLQNPTTDDDAIPKPIREILQKSLAADPAARYADIHEMRKAVDALLFSGDFSPTTFNLAFFMHSLFRDDIDRETKTLQEEKEATYLEFLAEDAAKPPAVAAVAPAAAAASAVAAPQWPRPREPPPRRPRRPRRRRR